MDWLIQVTGIADSEGEETTETICRGVVQELPPVKGGGFLFDYQTADDENPADITANVITVNGERARILRKGSVNAEILVVPGETHPCIYETAYGTLSFDIAGREVTVTKEENRIVAGLSYEILSGGDILSSNTIRITAEPVRTEKGND